MTEGSGVGLPLGRGLGGCVDTSIHGQSLPTGRRDLGGQGICGGRQPTPDEQECDHDSDERGPHESGG